MTRTDLRMGVISGFFPGRRLNSHINHSAYCRAHGYYYIDASHPGTHPRPYFRKIEVILEYLSLFDWVFWLDDDAYFTDFSVPLLSLLEPEGSEDIVICKSPSTKKVFTKFSCGQFFIRNSPRAFEFLKLVLQADLPKIKASFWRERHGLFTSSDQDAFVYLTETNPKFGPNFIRIVDHDRFNNRDFEYKSSTSEHFLIHFTGHEKSRDKDAFCRRIGGNDYLIPDSLLRTLNLGHEEGALGLSTWARARGKLSRYVPDRVRRFLRR